MNYRERLIIITKKLDPLTYTQQLLFGYLCSRRLLPNYAYFSRINHWGDVSVLENILLMIQSELIGDSKIEQVDIVRNQVFSITPDTEDFGDIYSSHALDAAMSIANLLSFIQTHKVESILDIIGCSIDTIWMNILENDTVSGTKEQIRKQTDLKVSSHPFMLRELDTQNSLLEVIKTVKDTDINQTRVEGLLALQYNNAKSTIDLA